MEKIRWNVRVKNEVLHGVKRDTNIRRKVKRKKADWIRHILHRDRVLKHVIEWQKEGRIEATG
jgi:hypothetical protein